MESKREDCCGELLLQENVSCGKNREGTDPERGTYLPSDENAGALFALLTEQEQQVILGSIKSLLSARQSTSVPPASTGS